MLLRHCCWCRRGFRQVVHTHLSPSPSSMEAVKWRWCPTAGKVTVGLASHWQCVIELSYLITYRLNGLIREIKPCLRSAKGLMGFFPLFCRFIRIKDTNSNNTSVENEVILKVILGFPIEGTWIKQNDGLLQSGRGNSVDFHALGSYVSWSWQWRNFGLKSGRTKPEVYL